MTCRLYVSPNSEPNHCFVLITEQEARDQLGDELVDRVKDQFDHNEDADGAVWTLPELQARIGIIDLEKSEGDR
jgi:hypothetical protein